MRLILASGSPRRRDLLRKAGFRFEVVAPDVPEIASENLTVRELTVCNATRKALAVARRRPSAVVLAADTVVALDGRTIGKPANLPDARRILGRLSGRSHQVYSAVFVCHAASRRHDAFHEVSRVRFRRLGEKAIAAYIKKVNPLDKAGGYAAQGDGGEIIARIDGSFTNVVGLPMERTIEVLRDFGVVAQRAQRI